MYTAAVGALLFVWWWSPTGSILFDCSVFRAGDDCQRLGDLSMQRCDYNEGSFAETRKHIKRSASERHHPK